VLATVRSAEAAPDPVVGLWKDGLTERIEVQVLDDQEIEELLVRVLGGPVDPASLRQLAHRCQGNPLFLRELVSGALETGALIDEGGLWRLRGGLRPTARLVELVALRLGDLSGPERAVLELPALGEPLEQAELDQLADPASVEILEQKGLITSRVEGRRLQVWLGHPVYGDVVRVGISALRERENSTIAGPGSPVTKACHASSHWRTKSSSSIPASLQIAGEVMQSCPDRAPDDRA
jgi:hypothetical protein